MLHSLVLLLLLLLPLLHGCMEEERQALLQLKRGLIDPDNYLLHWNSSSSQDCCTWLCVTCRRGEGNVIQLDLSNSGLSGKISPSLLSLKHLEELDLSFNDFQGTPIPPFIGSFPNLTSLNLEEAGFGGAIPPQLGMLRNLQHLTISNDIDSLEGERTSQPRLYAESFQWVSNLSFLIDLQIENVDLRRSSDWALLLSRLQSLRQLRLSNTGLSGKISPSLLSLKHLEDLDLSRNDFQGTPIPSFIGSFSNLTGLHLANAGFGGQIPSQLGMLLNLQQLTITNSLDSGGEKTPSHPLLYVQDFRWVSNLSSLNRLAFENVDLGRASDWELSLSRCPLLEELTLDSCNLSSLRHGGKLPSLSSGNGYASLLSLDLSHNHKLGKSFIPTWISSLRNLMYLGLAECSLDGVVTEHHFSSNLTSLETLDMSNNPLLQVQITPDWVPPFNLSFLDLSSCQVGPGFPLWLRTQETLESLILSNARLQDSLPTWIWDFAPSLSTLDLSQNQLHDVVPDFSSHSATYLDLSSNNFSGQLPAHLSSSRVEYLNLSYNSFSGCLSNLLCDEGGNPKSLILLDLDNNLLSGNMSNCWGKWNKLEVVSISKNNLTGSFSESLANLGQLLSLHLRNNSLSGALTFLKRHNWTNLVTLDLGINRFNGNMKSTYWKKFSDLRFLMLDSNEIPGIIPREICNLENLQILNLASNNLSGIIPTCFENFRGMKVKPETSNIVVVAGNWWLNKDNNYENLQLFLKGRVDEYGKTLGLVTHLDISNNHLSGKIPKELMNLTWLYSFNLSRNQLSGPIPMNIGDMRLLSSLDLSMNQLSGEIPSTISQVTRLDHLNVSHNNLTGRIPSSTQLQSFDPSCYRGNTLCGEPLPDKCDQRDASSSKVNEHDGGNYKADSHVGFYIGFPIGFGASASTTFIILLFRHSWRISYFRFIDKTLNKLF